MQSLLPDFVLGARPTEKTSVTILTYCQLLQGARSIVSTEGIQGLYHGMLPTLLRDVPELALQFSIYEALRHFTETHRKVWLTVSKITEG